MVGRFFFVKLLLEEMNPQGPPIRKVLTSTFLVAGIVLLVLLVIAGGIWGWDAYQEYKRKFVTIDGVKYDIQELDSGEAQLPTPEDPFEIPPIGAEDEIGETGGGSPRFVRGNLTFVSGSTLAVETNEGSKSIVAKPNISYHCLPTEMGNAWIDTANLDLDKVESGEDPLFPDEEATNQAQLEKSVGDQIIVLLQKEGGRDAARVWIIGCQ
jgi:hypothetical protein